MPSKSAKAVDITLIVSETVLSALVDAAGSAPFPLLKEAAGSALLILQAVQASLAPRDPRVITDIKYASKYAKKRMIFFFFRSLLLPNRDENKIAGYSKAIEVAFRNFNFECNVDLREQATEIRTDVKEILQDVKHHRDTRDTLVVNTNTNSGNTTTTMVSDSNNNDSISYGDVTSLASPPPILVAPPVTDMTALLSAKKSINATINHNTNSGNTTNTTIMKSNNNSSLTVTGASRNSYRQTPPPSPQRLNFQRGIVPRY
ncbi:uncharacterized protein LACBIDRAFT_327508 [Laccaria bicolor S238N-H82]|uniref:Predicted protein n=1 Tax=Laccaria bicolor (strain S238N-H82 / ATCC MYA-4686) TaxID=486041 RepID=B0DBY7_LACBS|nr:uncharacterized protein LACBIDRAFT_327508 [Laccaria bicolor S238N-H82]EDR07800.1 predicted protein [Laccaria bicolor S238N-H82]|eukprot:XP_001881589.1 predicted protein [Laccaria bicolor S238N-H82]